MNSVYCPPVRPLLAQVGQRFLVLLAVALPLGGCSEPIDCAAEPSRCIAQAERPALKLPEAGQAKPRLTDAEARAILRKVQQVGGMRLGGQAAGGSAELRPEDAARGATGNAAAGAAPAGRPQRMPDLAAVRAGALQESDTMAARRRPDPAQLAAGRVPGLVVGDKPDQPPAADARVDDLRRFWKRIAPLLATKDLAKINEILTPEYAQKLKETVPQYTDRFWTHVGRYTTLLDTLPADGAGMRIAVTPGATPDELQLEITPNDGKMPLRPIVVRDGARWKLKRF